MPEPASAVQNSAYIRKIERRGWRTLWIGDNSRTASILRFTLAADGDWAAGIAPSPTQASDLANLPVVVSSAIEYSQHSRGPANIQIRETDLWFEFLDIPASGGESAGMITLKDVIEYDGKRFRPVEGTIINDTLSGITYVLARLTQR